MKIVTPQSMMKSLNARIAALKAEGKAVTVDNLNARFFKELKERLKEEGNE